MLQQSIKWLDPTLKQSEMTEHLRRDDDNPSEDSEKPTISDYTDLTKVCHKWRISTWRQPLQPWPSRSLGHIDEPRDRSPVRTSSPRHPSGKDPWTSGPLTLWLLQLEQTTDSSGWRGTGPPTEPGFSQGFLHSVTDGVFVPCRCRLWLAQLGTLHFQHNHRLDCTDII